MNCALQQERTSFQSCAREHHHPPHFQSKNKHPVSFYWTLQLDAALANIPPNPPRPPPCCGG